MPARRLPPTDAVRAALSEADFPATKDDLVRVAAASGAGEEVLSALRALPVEDYGARDEVLRSVETLDATGSTPAQHAAQSRAPAPPGLAQHQKSQRPS